MSKCVRVIVLIVPHSDFSFMCSLLFSSVNCQALFYFPTLSHKPDSFTMGTGSFPGVKRPERSADHPPSPSAEVENEYRYTSTPFSGPFVACYRVTFTFISKTAQLSENSCIT
jgi:hypothetical protein